MSVETRSLTPPETPLFQVYGVTFTSDFPFQTALPGGIGRPELVFECVEQSPFPDFRDRSRLVLDKATGPTPGIYSVYAGVGFEALCYEEIADFFVLSGRIACHILDENRLPEVEICFLGAVLAYWLERHGKLALHASAVVVGAEAIVFLGSNNGAGKSCLAASFLEAGYLLLADDVVSLGLDSSGAWMAAPGYPQMRMWDDLACRFVRNPGTLDLVLPGCDKKRVPVGPKGIGLFCPRTVPIAGFCVPVRQDDCQIELVQLSKAAALLELVRASFLPRTVESLGFQPRRLETLARLAKTYPISRLSYPSGFEHLSDVRSAILGAFLPAPSTTSG